MVDKIVSRLIDSQSKHDRECSNVLKTSLKISKGKEQIHMEKKSDVLLYKMNKDKIMTE